MQNIFILLFSFLIGANAFGQAKQLEAAASAQPFERLYLQTDHNEYRPGQYVFVKAYLTDDNLRAPTEKGEHIFVQLLNPKGKMIAQSNLFCFSGQQADGLYIPPHEPGGIFTLRAFTERMSKGEEEVFFEKEIVVRKSVRPKLRLRLELERNQYLPGETIWAKLDAQAMDNAPIARHACRVKLFFDGKITLEKNIETNGEGAANFSIDLPDGLPNSDGLLQVSVTHEGITETVAKPVPVARRKLTLQFFPEGGDLIFGTSSRVAFEVTDEKGLPVDTRGWFFSAAGDTLSALETAHKGMGTFEFSAKNVKGGYAKLEGQNDKFPLEARFASYGIRMAPPRPRATEVEVEIFQPMMAEGHVVLRSGNRVVWEKRLDFGAVPHVVKLPLEKLPAGIAQLTLFDEMGQPRAERLFFANAHRQLSVVMKTDQEKYLPSEQVTVNLEVKDETGQPVDGDFSAAVVDDAEWTQAEDKQADIRSRLLLTSELRGHVEEPSFYFDEKEPEAKRQAALDLLLLTHGWRRFTWEEAFEKTEEEWKAIAKSNRKPIHITGYAWMGEHREGIIIQVPGTDHKTETDKNGRFKIEVTGLAFPLTLEAKYGRRMTRKLNCNFPNRKKVAAPPLKMKETVSLSAKKVIEMEVEEVETEEVTVKDIGSLPTRAISGFAMASSVSGDLLGSRSLEEVVVVGYSSTVGQDNVSRGILLDNVGPGMHNENAPLGDELHLGSIWDEGSFDLNLRQDYHYHGYGYARRQFYQTPQAARQRQYEKFQKSIFWQPNVQVNNGKGTFSFFNHGGEGTYRIILEGVGQVKKSATGRVGHAELTYHTERPISVSMHLPEAVTYGDTILAEINAFNRTENLQPVELMVMSRPMTGSIFDTLFWDKTLRLPADSMLTFRLPIPAGFEVGKNMVTAILVAQPEGDVVSKNFEVRAKGFPKALYLSGRDEARQFNFWVEEHLPSSLEASLVAYPSLLSQMDEGLESILRTPHGCFEQVTSSNYPNVMALQVLQGSNAADLDFRKNTHKMLDVGYGKLSGYEAPGGGFSLYGRGAGSVRLTAYGLLQLTDMKEVYPKVSEDLLSRSRKWLQSQRTSSQFRELDLTHLFTLYVLSEIGHLPPGENTGEVRQFTELDLAGFDAEAEESGDIYRLSILACANLNAGRPIGKSQVNRLRQILRKQGPGKMTVTPTFALSYGRSYQVEAAAWAALALLKSGERKSPEVLDLLTFLHESRDGRGGFGSTQGTVMALKALQLFNEKSTDERMDGKIIVTVNGRSDTLEYGKESHRRVEFDLSPYFKVGENEIAFRQMSDGGPIPFTVLANWQSMELPRQTGRPLRLSAQLAQTKVRTSEFVRMDIELKNELEEAVNAPLAIIGLPAGLSLQNWQIRELYEREVFDHFEIIDDRLVIYYEKLPAGAARKFHLDLKADLAGSYQAPASVAYPYYSEEEKYWVAGAAVWID